jgi:hypothetical protein
VVIEPAFPVFAVRGMMQHEPGCTAGREVVRPHLDIPGAGSIVDPIGDRADDQLSAGYDDTFVLEPVPTAVIVEGNRGSRRQQREHQRPDPDCGGTGSSLR